MTKHLLRPKCVWTVAAWALVMGAWPGGAAAMPSRSVPALQQGSLEREAQVEAILNVLSKPAAQIHLRAAGLNPAELRARLSALDDAQLACLSRQANRVKAAGQLEILIVLLVIAIIAVVVISLMGKEVKVKDKKKGAL